ncbi:MAG: transporter ATP-binding protein [Rickettsiaceae bacterium]|jgi:putative ABC transport system ATP-binding protein|nr:transporter ATP-binding protein [Rickettsiaceae bacterium]
MLELIDITKSFPGRFEPTLKSINLEIHKGEFCVIIGSNGSGKSTLMRCISGEYKVDHGRININGENFTYRNRSKLIATVVQDVNKGTIPELSLLENMVFSMGRRSSPKLTMYRKFKEEISDQIKELNLRLEAFIDTPLATLSGGQRQMVATIMAVNSKPEILLLDEHTSALDPRTQSLLMEFTASTIRNNKLTSLMITHKLDDAIKFGNRLIMLHQGRIVMDVKGQEKTSLTIDQLIALFHKYEDLTLQTNLGGI